MSNKIFVPLAISEHNRMGGEAIFAVRLRPGVYRVDCVPLFADLHHGDVIQCDESSDTVIPTFIGVLERADLVTVHLLLTPKGYRKRIRIVLSIEQAGFYVECVEGKLYAINAPASQLDELNRWLSAWPECLRWWLDGQEDRPTESK